MINNCVFMGRLVRDPELRSTGSGVSVCSFCIAVDRNYTPKDGEKIADFIDMTAWRGTAEFISKWFHKGDMIAVTGEMQTRMYEDKEGNKRKAVEIVVNNASFCGGKSEGGNTEAPAPAPTSDFAPITDDDAQLPF